MKLTLFPTDLSYFILLKYIAISCDLKVLPEKISNLWNLQTLIVETTARTFQIKADIWKMPHLRHLDVTTSAVLLTGTKEEFSQNQNLQTLSTISPESCKDEVFDRTPMLKKLGILGELAPFFEASGKNGLFSSLSKVEQLENLKLLNDTTSASQQENFPKQTV